MKFLLLVLGLALAVKALNGPWENLTANVFLSPSNTFARLSYSPEAQLMAFTSNEHKTVTNFEWGLQYRSCSGGTCSVQAVSLEMPKFYVDDSSLEFRSPLCADFSPDTCERHFLNFQLTMNVELVYSVGGILQKAHIKSKDGIVRMSLVFANVTLTVDPNDFYFGSLCVAHCSRPIDTAIILDSSESISDPEWESSRLFAEKFGKFSNMSIGGMNIGLVVFARDADLYPPTSSLFKYQQIASQMSRQDTGQTNLGYAILQAKDMLHEARDLAKKVVIFISDGLVQVYCDPDGADTTQCIDPGSAAQTLNSTFGDNIEVYGLIVTDFNPSSAATFDSITGTSKQFSLQGSDPLTWAAVYILDNICNEVPQGSCRECPYFLCGCDNKCSFTDRNNSIDTPVPDTTIVIKARGNNDALWAILPVGVLVLGAIAGVLVAIYRRKKNGAMVPMDAAQIPPIEPLGVAQNVHWT